MSPASACRRSGRGRPRGCGCSIPCTWAHGDGNPLGVPFVLAAAGAQRAFKLYAVARRHARTVMRIGGCLLIVDGLLEVSGLWAELINRIQVLVVTWRPPL